MDITKFKETLLEFLGDVTTIRDDLKKSFIDGNMKNFFDAPDGYKVLSPFLLVKIVESTRVIDISNEIVEFFDKDTNEYTNVKPKFETYFCCIKFKLFMENYEYCIKAIWREYTPRYLDCVSDSRKPRAGENWNRGNDMYDGHFCRETWNKIKDDIISHEMKGIAKYIVNGRYTKEN